MFVRQQELRCFLGGGGDGAAAAEACSLSLSRFLSLSLSPARSLDVLVASLKVSLKTLSRQRKEFHFLASVVGWVAFGVTTGGLHLSLVVWLAL